MMKDAHMIGVSRLQWMALTVPVVAASFGPCLLTASGKASEPPANTATNENTLGARSYNDRDFGAKGDGSTLDTAAVQAAIDACTRDRGGIVLIPAGDFVVGTLELKSNVTLRLSAKGRLVGSAKIEDYKAGSGLPPSNG